MAQKSYSATGQIDVRSKNRPEDWGGRESTGGRGARVPGCQGARD